MRITCKTVWLPKDGCAAEEYEDAFAPGDFDVVEVTHFSCAVADGATEASFSDVWAKMLVEDFVQGLPISDTRERFAEEIDSKELSWYAEQKAGMGAFAAIIGLEILEDKTWRAEAIGDANLFHLRDDKIIHSFPVERSEFFGNTPELLSSQQDGAEAHIRLEGNWLTDDVFILCTDAFAKWILQHHEGRSFKMEALGALRTNEDLKQFAEIQRGAADVEGKIVLRNDDLTLMRVGVS